ncbi:MAG: hypothetical protein ACFCU1_10645 [Sumerlaeia bacterium]
MLSQELQSPAVISFAVFGFVMTVGYIYYRVQRDKAARGAEGLPPRPRGSSLEKSLQQELEELRQMDHSETDEGAPPEQRSVEEARRMAKKYYEKKHPDDDDDLMGGYLPPHG